MAVLEQLKAMSTERFQAIYAALVEQGFGPLDAQVAASLKFRPQAIRKLPLETRCKRARALLERGQNAELTYELFGRYLMRNQPKLVTGFLDATGVAHEEGIVNDVNSAVPEESKVGPAIEALERDFSSEDVALYLSLAAEQWPQVDGLAEAWRQRLAAPA
jgi:hypothetical protein